jgi:hypothetical protein
MAFEFLQRLAAISQVGPVHDENDFVEMQTALREQLGNERVHWMTKVVLDMYLEGL